MVQELRLIVVASTSPDLPPDCSTTLNLAAAAYRAGRHRYKFPCPAISRKTRALAFHVIMRGTTP